MIRRCKELVRRYPYLALYACGFLIMLAPVVLLASWLSIGLFLENTGGIPLDIAVFLTNILKIVVSTPMQIVCWTVLALGFGTMNLGVILHYRNKSWPSPRPPPSQDNA